MMGLGAWVYQRVGGLDKAADVEKAEVKEVGV
jgi:hypothetical protein